MNRKIMAVLAAVLLSGACAKKMPAPLVMPEAEPVKTSSTEGSLWPGESNKNTLFADNKALRVGDIITVYLVENAKAANRTINNGKSSVMNTIGISTGSTSTPTDIGVGGGQEFRGSGDSSRADALTATLSAMVQEVYPNGNMRIAGQRKMKINNEDQYIAVAGFVRKEDVNFDNSILSTKIANADITYDGVGDLDHANSGGWLTRALKSAWPF